MSISPWTSQMEFPWVLHKYTPSLRLKELHIVHLQWVSIWDDTFWSHFPNYKECVIIQKTKNIVFNGTLLLKQPITTNGERNRRKRSMQNFVRSIKALKDLHFVWLYFSTFLYLSILSNNILSSTELSSIYLLFFLIFRDIFPLVSVCPEFTISVLGAVEE